MTEMSACGTAALLVKVASVRTSEHARTIVLRGVTPGGGLDLTYRFLLTLEPTS